MTPQELLDAAAEALKASRPDLADTLQMFSVGLFCLSYDPALYWRRCAVCGNLFKITRSDHVICSPACRQASSRAAHKEKA